MEGIEKMSTILLLITLGIYIFVTTMTLSMMYLKDVNAQETSYNDEECRFAVNDLYLIYNGSTVVFQTEDFKETIYNKVIDCLEEDLKKEENNNNDSKESNKNDDSDKSNKLSQKSIEDEFEDITDKYKDKIREQN